MSNSHLNERVRKQEIQTTVRNSKINSIFICLAMYINILNAYNLLNNIFTATYYKRIRLWPKLCYMTFILKSEKKPKTYTNMGLFNYRSG